MPSSSAVPLGIFFFFCVLVFAITVAVIENSGAEIKDFQLLISSSIALVATSGGLAAVFISQGRTDRRHSIDQKNREIEENKRLYDAERTVCAIMRNNINRVSTSDSFFVFITVNEENLDPIERDMLFQVNPIIANRYLAFFNLANRYRKIIETVHKNEKEYEEKFGDEDDEEDEDNEKSVENDKFYKKAKFAANKLEVEKKVNRAFLGKIINRNIEVDGVGPRPIADHLVKKFLRSAKREVEKSNGSRPENTSGPNE